jgi:hypothetical protein
MNAIQEISQPLFKIGDRVRRRHAWDGSSRSGVPTGPILTITRIFSGETFAIYQLLDGRTEFEFNLCADAVESQWLCESKSERLAS